MQVNNLILYQVATDRNYKVGDKIHFGDESNGQEFNCLNMSFYKDGEPLHKLGFNNAKKGIFKNKKLMIDISKALSNYDFIMREFALEEVRREKFLHLPSRFRCMFLSENAETCLNNLQGFVNRGAGKNFQAIKVKVDGEAHFVKDYGVDRLGLSFNEYKKQAEKYWAQDQNSNSACKEILFVGDVEVVEILKEINKDWYFKLYKIFKKFTYFN